MVIVSPQAKAAFVDHGRASFDSMLAFVEQNWGLTPLTTGDATAYDYCRSFVFTTLPCTGPAPPALQPIGRRAPLRIPLQLSPVSAASLHWVRAHPGNLNDPT
jgi:hypothetical protein